MYMINPLLMSILMNSANASQKKKSVPIFFHSSSISCAYFQAFCTKCQQQQIYESYEKMRTSNVCVIWNIFLSRNKLILRENYMWDEDMIFSFFQIVWGASHSKNLQVYIFTHIALFIQSSTLLFSRNHSDNSSYLFYFPYFYIRLLLK